MRAEVVLDNVHTGAAASGRSIHDNLQSAGAADERNTAARSVRKVHGVATDSGASQPSQVMESKEAAKAGTGIMGLIVRIGVGVITSIANIEASSGAMKGILVDFHHRLDSIA